MAFRGAAMPVLLLALLGAGMLPVRAVEPLASATSECLSGDIGACMEADIEEAEEDLAEAMQVGLFQRLPLEMVHGAVTGDSSSTAQTPDAAQVQSGLA
mmetsp:Transcript_145836/g.406204  ORF Transcript_145836/g.406204 Transcript_145836/m.406204 type:complete len:99 (+) Transcript_145836:85-381(+)|eukprot:CAMPEP_0179122278 /NCGR_PEP_ID=MMETSP0796-20121207/57706_1 /TAXON_ID=73915 /ORGANISM="Pyrodinium bahamense, Strain pbaha01" /LENGTH=98 /DNA_ID=CAMNT_0020820901 /DNA_START=85 /DNA_END=381 /DNA_ORIENTATION=+